MPSSAKFEVATSSRLEPDAFPTRIAPSLFSAASGPALTASDTMLTRPDEMVTTAILVVPVSCTYREVRLEFHARVAGV